MAAEWYYAKGDKQIGPVPEAELRGLVQSGQLSPSDKVWKEGMSGWEPASQVKGLLPGDDPQRKKSGPPPLSVAASTAAGPWPDEDRTAPNPLHLWAKIGAGVCVLIGFLCIASGDAAIMCLPFFSAAILIVVMTFFRHLLVLHGRWVPAEGGKGWVEFVFGGVFRQEDGLVGTFVVLKNKRFIDIRASGKLVDSWRIISMQPNSLEIQDSSGRTRSFKKGKTLAEQQSAFFTSNRTKYLEGHWQPITDSSEWMQFTKDGAVVFSDGTAGRFTVVGEEPNEVIEMQMVGGNSKRFQIVSLTQAQLVIAENDEATTFQRRSSGSGNRQATGTTDVASSSTGGTVTMSSATGTTPPSSSSQWWDCPWCGVTYQDDHYSPNETVVCSDCNCRFQKKQAINLRRTRERVETKNLLGRLWSGSSIQTPRRQRLIEKIKNYESMIRIYSNPAVMGGVQHLQQAQLLQMKIAEMKKELEDHGG